MSVEPKTAEDDVPSRHGTMHGSKGISKWGREAGSPVETNGGVAPHSEHAQGLQTKDHNIKP